MRDFGDDEEKCRIGPFDHSLSPVGGAWDAINTSDAALTMAQDGSIDKFVALYEEEIVKDNRCFIRGRPWGKRFVLIVLKSHDVVSLWDWSS